MIRIHTEDDQAQCTLQDELTRCGRNVLPQSRYDYMDDETGSDQITLYMGSDFQLTPTDTAISIHGQRLSTIAAMSTRRIEDYFL